MGELWDKYIQPVLDSWHRWDNYSWVWEPFLENYPKFDDLQRTNVEIALVESAFDPNQKLAIKALSIVETLYRQKLSSGKLIERMTDRLRNQIILINLNDEISPYYIFAFSTFGMIEAVPFIKSVLSDLEKTIDNIDNEGKKDNYESMLWACCMSLSTLNPEEAKPSLSLLLEYDKRMGFLPQFGQEFTYSGLTCRALLNQWGNVGINGLEAILLSARDWTEEQRNQIFILVTNTIQRNYKISPEEKQEAQKLAKKILRISQ